VNYFELHIGDYAEATGHLSMLEDGAYWRLMRKYYAKEKPLPADVAEVQRLAGARTKEEKLAVQAVLRDFFDLRDDGWHNKRCDEDIVAFQAGEPEREVKRTNEDLRVKRHREERAALFKQLNDAGQHAPWNTNIKELRALVAGLSGNAPATPPGQPATHPVTPPVTAPATPATATQYPSPNTQLPELKEEERALPAAEGKPVREPTAAGRIGRALKRGGMDPATFNTSDPRIAALAEQGATEEEVEAVAREAVSKGRGLGWVAATVKGRRADAAAITLAPAPQSVQASRDVERTQEWLREHSRELTPEEKAKADEARRRAMAAVKGVSA